MEKLYESLFSQGQYTKSFEEFKGQFGTEDTQKKLYSVLNENGEYTKSFDEFKIQFFKTTPEDFQEGAATGVVAGPLPETPQFVAGEIFPEQVVETPKITESQSDPGLSELEDANISYVFNDGTQSSKSDILKNIKNLKIKLTGKISSDIYDFKDGNAFKIKEGVSDDLLIESYLSKFKNRPLETYADSTLDEIVITSTKNQSKAKEIQRKLNFLEPTDEDRQSIIDEANNIFIPENELPTSPALLMGGIVSTTPQIEYPSGYKEYLNKANGDLNKAKELYIKDKNNNLKADKLEEFARNTDVDIEPFFKEQEKAAKIIDKNLAKQFAAKGQVISEYRNDIEAINNELFDLIPQINSEDINSSNIARSKFAELRESQKILVDKTKSLIEDRFEIAEESEDNSLILDVVKRSYSTPKIATANITASISDLVAGVLNIPEWLTNSIISTLTKEDSLITRNALRASIPQLQQAGILSEAASNFSDKLRNKVAKPIDVADINSLSDLGYWSTDLVSNQLPNTALMIAAPEVALPILSASATGNKYSSMIEGMQKYGENYEGWQLITAPLIVGSAEYLTERISLGQLKGARNILRKSPDALKAANKYIEENIAKGRWFKSTFGEGAAEGLNAFTENATDIYLLNNKEKHIWDGVPNAFASGGFMSGVIYKAPAIGSRLLRPFSDSNLQTKLTENFIEFEKISKELNNNKNLSESAKNSLVEAQIRITNNSNQLIQNNLESIDGLSDTEKSKLIDIDKKTAKIEAKAFEIRDDESLDTEIKNILISELNNEYTSLKNEKKAIIELGKRDVLLEKAIEQGIVGNLTFKSFDNEVELQDYVENSGRGKDMSLKASSNYGTIFQNIETGEQEILINKELSAKHNRISTADHEFLHAILFQTLKDSPESAINLGKSLYKELEVLSNNLSDTDFKQRLNNEIQDFKDGNKKESEAWEEALTLFSEGLVNKEFSDIFKDSSTNKSFIQTIKEFLQRLFGKTVNTDIEFNTGSDVIQFIRDYNKSFQTGKWGEGIKKLAAEGARGRLVDTKVLKDLETEAEEVVKASRSQEASDRVQKIYEDQGVNGAFEIIQEFKPIVDKIVEKRRGAPNFDKQLLTDEIETGNRGLFDLIREYKPESNVPLAAFINRFLPARSIEASRRVLGEEFTADVTERVDIAAEETAVETVDEKAEARKIKPSSFISKDAVEKIKEQVSERIKDVPADKLTFKRLGDLAPEIIAEEIGIPVKKLTVPAANLSKGDASAIQRFITKNADKLLKILPEGAVTEAASEKLLGTSTGVAKGLLNAFYDKQARGTKGAGLSPFTLKKDISRADFLEAFGIVEGKKAEGFSARSSQAQALKGIASLYGRLVTNEIVRSEIDLAPEVAQDIAAGKARVMFSKAAKFNSSLNKVDYSFANESDINETRNSIINNIAPGLSAEEFINIFLGTSKRAYKQGKIIEEVKIEGKKQKRIVRFKEDGDRFSTRQFLFLNTEDFRKTLKDAYPEINFEFKRGQILINDKTIITTSPNQSTKGIVNGDFENGRGTNTMPSLQERQNFAIQQKESMRKVIDIMKEKFSSGDLTANQVAMILQNFNSSVDALIRTAAVPSIFTSEETIKLVEQKLKRKLTDKDFLYEHSQTASDTLVELSKIITNEPDAYTFDEIMNSFRVAIIPKVYTKLIDASVSKGGAGLRSDGRRNNDGNLILNEGTNITRYDDAADIFAREGLPKLVLNEIKPNEIKASQKTANINNKELPIKFKKSKSANNNQVLNTMQELDKKADEARTMFSKAFDLNKDFNKIIENKTDIAAEDVYSKSLAQVKGAGKGKYDFFIPPSAEDFVGLLYKNLGKGKLGDQQMAWYKTHLLNPFARGIENISRERVTLMNDFVALKKQLKVVPKNLRKKLGDTGFTREQGVRVYVWSKQGMEIPETNKSDIDAILKEFNKFEDLKLFGDQLVSINKGDGYPAPENSWTSGTITTDLLNGLNTTKRQKHLEQWQENVDIIFSKENLNKLQAAYGENYVAALKGHLERMKSGRNRKLSPDKLTSRFNDWVNGSVGAIMFFNARSAVLQTISAINFINFTDNNPLKAGLAFANQKQYWADFKMLFNSDFLVERRDGAKLTVQEADIADMAKGKGARGVISGLLKFGFLPTQLADSFAIASGGATFYRNRLNTYLNEKNEEGENVYTEKQAKELAFRDFREISEESQQSSRPDKISQQQAGPLGRVILAFANTSAQYTRIIKKAALDLKNRRGDDKTNISKIIYYGVIQNVVFNALQQAVFALAFGDEDDEELTSEKYVNTANGMVDSILRGIGIGGAIVSTGKNAILRIIRENEKDRPNYERVADEFLKISPPVSSKYSKIVQAARSYTWNKKEMKEKGFSLDNPAYLANAKVISSLTNIPLDRAIKKIENIENALYEDIEPWQRAALLAGWSDWQLDIKKKENKKEKVKTGRIKEMKIKEMKIK